jgi:DNA-binding NarL/FixJ family response regulator
VGIKVLIADDDALARALIEEIIKRDDELELVGSAGDASEAIALAGEHRPDVAVLDWVMPGGGGPAAAREIQVQSPDTKIVALTSSDSPEAEMDMLRAGAGSFLVKGCTPEELVRTVRAAQAL